MNKFWTPTEIELLIKLYPIYGIKRCAFELNRTENSVAKKALRLGISAPGGRLKPDSVYKTEASALGLVPLDTYAGANIPIRHKCAKGHVTKIRPSNILQGGGCSVCGNRSPISTNDYRSKIAFDVLDEYVTSSTPITHRCSKGHTWKAAPSNVLRGSGCPSCSNSGFNLNSPAIFYYIKIVKDNLVYYKVGITNRTVIDRFSRDRDKTIIVLYQEYYSKGSEAKEVEQEILSFYSKHRVKIDNFLKSGGNSELFEQDILGLDF